MATSSDVTFPATDGRVLAGTWVEPEGEARSTVVIGSATGVKRGFYAPFAAFLAGRGHRVLTFDYRGVGGSVAGPLRSDPTRMCDWGELDMPAALELARARGAPQLFIGHSAGGQMFGLVPAPQVKAALFVGAQSGYWRHWSGTGRLAMWGLWHLLVPIVVPLAGKLPMKALGQGEDVPPGMAQEWAEWGRHPNYLQKHVAGRSGLAFDSWRGRLRCCAVSDDGYAPGPSVRALAAMFRAAEVEVVEVTPAQAKAKGIGHFGLFRKSNAETLWVEAAGWLEAAL